MVVDCSFSQIAPVFIRYNTRYSIAITYNETNVSYSEKNGCFLHLLREYIMYMLRVNVFVLMTNNNAQSLKHSNIQT